MTRYVAPAVYDGPYRSFIPEERAHGPRWGATRWARLKVRLFARLLRPRYEVTREYQKYLRALRRWEVDHAACPAFVGGACRLTPPSPGRRPKPCPPRPMHPPRRYYM